MSKRIVLVDAFGYELFSGSSALGEAPAQPDADHDVRNEDARQGGPLESGIFFRGTPRLRKKDGRAA